MATGIHTNRLTESERRHLRHQAQTPADFWRVIKAEFDPQIDVSATASNAMCPVYLTPRENAFKTPWFRDGIYRAWNNPPFKNCMAWVQRHLEQIQAVRNGVSLMLGPLGDARWLQLCERKAYEVRILTERIEFMPPPGLEYSNNRQVCVLVVFRPLPVGWPGARVWYWNWRKQLEGITTG